MHTHTETRTHTHKNTHTYANTCETKHKNTPNVSNARTHRPLHFQSELCPEVTSSFLDPNARMTKHRCFCAHTQQHRQQRTHSHAATHAHTHTPTHAHTCTLAHMHPNTHTHTRKHTHTHALTLTSAGTLGATKHLLIGLGVTQICFHCNSANHNKSQ